MHDDESLSLGEPQPESGSPEQTESVEGVELPVEETEESAPAEELPPSPFKWYIIHTYSGFENKVAESLRTRADAFGFSDKIGQILIPTEEVVEMRSGQKRTSKRLIYPG